MAGFWERRRARKTGKEWLRHARHFRRMREDVAPASDVAALREAEAGLRAAVRDGDVDRIESGCATAEACVRRLAPPRPYAGLRENLEVIVVAVAVAMAFRTYFLQPFKIPTGSMQPTLYGIHYSPQEAPTLADKMPLNCLKWLAFGEWYTEIKATASGVVKGPLVEQGDMRLYYIGGQPQQLPKNSTIKIRQGDEVVVGQVIATGNEISGDHLFVNRVAWNVRSPDRGEVMVFKTDGIMGLEPKTHYIKRLVGLPGESVGIDDPYLMINGRRVEEPGPIRRIEQRLPGYSGYHPAGAGADYLARAGQTVPLGKAEFFGMGDNTLNSKDSRYWGPVPSANMVGPAWIVYWPLSRRWGRVD